MRMRISHGRLTVVTSDGRNVQYPLALLAVVAAPFLVAAIAFRLFALRDGSASPGRDVWVALDNLTAVEPVPRDSALPSVELVVSQNTLVEMERALAGGDVELRHADGGDRPYLNALVLDRGAPTPCEIAFIAPASRHDRRKPSLRIKVRKRLAEDGARRVDLHRPEDPLASDALVYSVLARRVDVIDARPAPTRLFVNRSSFGVYWRALPPGPAMARAASRLPGTFLIGEPGAATWSDPGRWRPHDVDADDPVPLDGLLALLAETPSPAAAESLRAWVDFESFARWAAVRAVLGRVDHAQAEPVLFFAPRHGRFEAVAWPFDGTEERDAASGALHPLLAHLEQDPRWTARRDTWIAELLTAEVDALVADELERSERALEADLAADLGLVARDGPDGSLQRVALRSLAERRAAAEQRRLRRCESLRAALAERIVGVDEPLPAEVVLGPGDVALDQDLVTAPGQPLVVRAGTRITLGPGVGIYARGPTRLEGTAERPISLAGADWRPWATLALLGPATGGSLLAHVELDGGAGGALGRQQLPAPFSVYECPDVVLRACRFGPHAAGGDSVQLARTRAVLEECTFAFAQRDALDVVFAEGRIDRCRFEGADRHGVDLSGSAFELERCEIDGAYGAAVSAGEGARVRMTDCVLQRSDVGIDCRDDARVLVRGGRLHENRLAVSCTNRDWRHDRAGEVALDGVELAGSLEGDLIAGARSRVVLRAVPRLRTLRGASRVERVEELADDWLAVGGAD